MGRFSEPLAERFAEYLRLAPVGETGLGVGHRGYRVEVTTERPATR